MAVSPADIGLISDCGKSSRIMAGTNLVAIKLPLGPSGSSLGFGITNETIINLRLVWLCSMQI